MKLKLALFGKLALLAWLFAMPVWASEEIGRREDEASADSHVLMPIGCVRQDSVVSSTSADGDYGHIKCNSSGRTYTSATIDAALPTGTNSIGRLGANSGVIIGDINVVSSIPAGANAIGSVSITSIVPGTGATNIGKAEDAAHVSGDTGVPIWGVRHDTSTTGLGADGDYAALGLNAAGELYTVANTELPAAAVLADNSANPTVPGVAAYMMCYDGTNWDRCLPGLSDTDDNSVAFGQVTSLVIGANHVSDGTSWIRLRTFLEDTAAAGHDGGQLFVVGGVRQDTPAGSTSADGDYANVKLDSVGRLWVNCGAGCTGVSVSEDAASAGGESMTLAGVVRQDTPASSTSLDGDFTWLKSDSLGRLWVNCGTGCSSTTINEDTASADANPLVPVAAVRQDTPAGSTTADGDYTWLKSDSLGRLWVNCGSGCSAVSVTEDAVSTGGEGMTLVAAIRQDTIGSTTSADGDYSNLKVNNIGRLYTSATIDAALPAGTNNIGDVDVVTMPGTGVEDVAETAGGTLMMMGSVRRDTATTSTGSDGENATVNTDGLGRLWVNPGFLGTEDAAETAGAPLGMVGTVRRDVATSSAGTTGDNATANTDALGLLWTRSLDPCNGVAKVSVPINIATATTTELVAASASNFVYVCSLNIGPTAGAQNIALIEDDTAACASPTAGLAGGTTAASGWNIAANGGLTFGNGLGMIAKTAAANRYVCLISSAAVQTSGVLTYALAP